MSTRAQALADKLERTNSDMVAAIQSLSDAQWQATCGGDSRTVGVVAHHVAGSHKAIGQLVASVAAGQFTGGPTSEQIDGFNAHHAIEHADCTKEEALALLATTGPTAVQMVREFSDEELDRAAGPYGNTEAVIGHILIGHVQTHLNDMRAAVADASPA